MPVDPYGVLVGKVVGSRREGREDDTPHYQVHVQDAAGTSYRVAVNVKSSQSPSELLYVVDDDFSHPITARLSGLGSGWTVLDKRPESGSVDFIRGNFFDKAVMRLLPPDAEGPDNDLSDLFDRFIDRAIADPDALVFAFGERWGPETGTRDKVFGFEPGNGVHNIHMNQGNSPQFRRDDGVWQDGALLLHFPAQSRWVAVFLAFQSQAWHTDDQTGRAIVDPATGAPAVTETDVRIIAALVNPVGPAPERELVMLINTSPAEVSLVGWSIADRLGNTCPVTALAVPAGSTVSFPVSAPVTLGNRGGEISLLNAEGLKVHGVAYTAERARREGWTITF